MKHAYLILAHTKFQVLKTLIGLLDNADNDIYIHFDKKVKILPELKSQYSKIIILEKRTDVHWGDVSMIEAEYNLFDEANKQKKYDYYHLISGVDLPIQSTQRINQFFIENEGKEFIGFSNNISAEEINKRVQYYHLFPHSFQKYTGFVNFLKRSIRYGFIQIQKVFNIKRNPDVAFKKGTQWISVTHEFVKYLISQKKWVLKNFQNTYCGDEIFVQTLCWNSKFIDKVYDTENEGNGSQRCIGWVNGELKDFEEKDVLSILSSDLLFARKFSENPIILNQVVNHVK